MNSEKPCFQLELHSAFEATACDGFARWDNEKLHQMSLFFWEALLFVSLIKIFHDIESWLAMKSVVCWHVNWMVVQIVVKLLHLMLSGSTQDFTQKVILMALTGFTNIYTFRVIFAVRKSLWALLNEMRSKNAIILPANVNESWSYLRNAFYKLWMLVLRKQNLNHVQMFKLNKLIEAVPFCTKQKC